MLQTGQTGQDRQRTDSIGLTVLQTVAQKPLSSAVICARHSVGTAYSADPDPLGGGEGLAALSPRTQPHFGSLGLRLRLFEPCCRLPIIPHFHLTSDTTGEQ